MASLLRLVGLTRHSKITRLVSLSNFHPTHTSPHPILPQGGRHTQLLPCAGRRNIFLTKQPAPNDNEGADTLARLYGTNRFNSDEDEFDRDDEDTTIDDDIPEPAPPQDTDDDDEDDVQMVQMSTLPQPRNLRIKSAEFIKSSVTVESCPKAGYLEIAVIGRSNVGKSSLINLITGRSSLAMVSKTPGKTRCINHFLINNAWYLVDLPGYGYARASKEKVVSWNAFTREYFLDRETLAMVLLLIDASIPPLDLDLACAQWFVDSKVPFTLVFTKVDKKKKKVTGVVDNVAAFEEALAERIGGDMLPPSIMTSSRSGAGKAPLLRYLAQIREVVKKRDRGDL